MLAAMAAILESNADVEGMQALIEMISGKKVAVLTGAGVSTDSGIPDYRGKGVSKRTPMNISDFLSSHQSRQRYWAGAHVGWKSFSEAQPNQGHLALAAMEQAGIIEGIISQNVDGLHRQAGSAHVVDLHGCLDRVVCLNCGQQFDRSDVESKLSSLNPWLDELAEVILAPDGDAVVTNYASMLLPECTVCGGMLKPDVIFFGEYVPPKIFTAASNLIKRSDVLLIAGSSLVVNTGIRLLEQARRQRLPIVIVNRGETKGDKKATLKIEHGTSDVLGSLALSLGAGNLYEDIQ